MWANRAPKPQPSESNESVDPNYRHFEGGGDVAMPSSSDVAMPSSLNSTGASTQNFDAMDVTPTTTVTPPSIMAPSRDPTDKSAREASEGGPSALTPMSGASSAKLGKKHKPAKHLQGQKFLYRLGDTLGKGSYAKVKDCVALDTPEGELKFAVKIFKVSLLKRRKMWDAQVSGFKTAFDDVIREIAIMKRLSHDNVMNLHDVIDDPNANKLYMVMDFCPRGAIMETENMPCEPLAPADARRWFVDSVIGLDYLHFQGVVHYDLKPDNILIAGDGRAVISDFGVSRVHPNKSDTTVGSPGTPTYTAPEVWGVGAYAGKVADVWSLGVTLHAMVFGCLPYPATNQQDLIALVTDPTEWTCKDACEDAELLELLHGMMQKVPTARWDLKAVEQSPWVRSQCELRLVATNWERIEVSDSELAQAVQSGHVDNFRRTKHGTLMKLTEATEGDMYSKLQSTPLAAFLPNLINLNKSTGNRVLIEIEDLTTGLAQPCLMDIKMGLRTFTEADAHSTQPRKDLLEKMLKAAPDAATDEERRLGVVKLRYLQFREQSTSTKTLGFRVDAVQLSDHCDCTHVPSVKDLRLIATRDAVKGVIAQYMQQRRSLLESFAQQLHELRKTLEESDVFAHHQFIRTSVLLVYDSVTEETKVRIIDLARVSPTSRLEPPEETDEGVPMQQRRLNHRQQWQEGNEEDGYLTGLDNMIAVFEELLEAQMM